MAAGVVGGKCLGMQIAECHRDVDARQLPMSSDEKLNNEKSRKEKEESARKSRQTKIVEEKSKNGNRKTPLLQLPSRALLDWLHTLAHTHNHTHMHTNLA